MKKQRSIWIAFLTAAALLLVTTSVVFANSLMHDTPPFNPDSDEGEFTHWGPMHGRGFRRGLFGMGDPAMMDQMIDVVSQQTGLTLEEIESRLSEGERLFDMAIDAGMDEDVFFDLMAEVRKDYFADAVEDGWMSEERYQWMIERLEGAAFGNPDGFPCHQGQGNLSPMINGTQRGSGRRW